MEGAPGSIPAAVVDQTSHPAPGEHDPLTPNSVYTPGDPFRRGLPDYVHVVDSDEFELSLGSTAVVYASPCRSHAGQTGLASGLPLREAGDERIRIGLVHGQTFDLEDHQTTFPIERNAAVSHGLDYLAIGDTHSFRDVELMPGCRPSIQEHRNRRSSEKLSQGTLLWSSFRVTGRVVLWLTRRPSRPGPGERRHVAPYKSFGTCVRRV